MKLKKSIVAWILALALILINLSVNSGSAQAADLGNKIKDMLVGEKTTVSVGDKANLDFSESYNFNYKISETSTYIYQTADDWGSVTFKNYTDVANGFSVAAADINYNNYTQYVVKRVEDQEVPWYSSGSIGGYTTYRCYDVYPIASAEKAATPSSSLAEGYIAESKQATLTAAEGSHIYYTTDGKEPSVDSTKYDGAITIAPGTTLKIAAYETGKQRSDTATYVYGAITANGVTVTPADANVTIGKTQQFSAEIGISGSTDTNLQKVTWSIAGNNSNDTSISGDGLLTVAAAETANALTVKATSVFDNTKYGEVPVVINKDFVADNTESLDEIGQVITQINTPGVVNIAAKMGENGVVVPTSFLKGLKGKDLTVNVKLNNGIIWQLRGTDITGNTLKDVNFGVKLDRNAIDTKLLNKITDANKIVQVSLDHNGPFGFTMYMNLETDSQYAGQYANLMYYNPQVKKLEYQAAVKVGVDGKIRLPYNHASDYAIVISNKDLKPTSAEGTITGNTNTVENTTTKGNTATKETVKKTVTTKNTPGTGDSNSAIWLYVVVLVSAGGIIISLRKRKSN